MGGSSSPHLSRNDIKRAKSTCRKGRRKVFISRGLHLFCWGERFIPSSCIRKRDKTGRKIIQRVIERNFRRHCIFIETLTVSRKLTFTNRAILLLPSSLYTHIYIQSRLYVHVFSEIGINERYKFYHKNGKLLHESTTNGFIWRKNYLQKKKRKLCRRSKFKFDFNLSRGYRTSLNLFLALFQRVFKRKKIIPLEYSNIFVLESKFNPCFRRSEERNESEGAKYTPSLPLSPLLPFPRITIICPFVRGRGGKETFFLWATRNAHVPALTDF